MKVLWNLVLCCLVDRYQCYKRTYHLHLQASLTLKTEAVYCSATLILTVVHRMMFRNAMNLIFTGMRLSSLMYSFLVRVVGRGDAWFWALNVITLVTLVASPRAITVECCLRCGACGVWCCMSWPGFLFPVRRNLVTGDGISSSDSTHRRRTQKRGNVSSGLAELCGSVPHRSTQNLTSTFTWFV